MLFCHPLCNKIEKKVLTYKRAKTITIIYLEFIEKHSQINHLFKKNNSDIYFTLETINCLEMKLYLKIL